MKHLFVVLDREKTFLISKILTLLLQPIRNITRSAVFLLSLFYIFPLGAEIAFSRVLGQCHSVFSEEKNTEFFINQIQRNHYKKQFLEIWRDIPVLEQYNIAKNIFNQQGFIDVKKNLILAISKTDINNSDINRLLVEVLFKKEEFETVEESEIKEKILEALQTMKLKDPQIQTVLINGLRHFKSGSQFSIRTKIYSFFESIPEDLTKETIQSLAEQITTSISYKEKLRIIDILKYILTKKQLDIQTIKYLEYGLHDSSYLVRKTTAETLGEVLGVNTEETLGTEKPTAPVVILPNRFVHNFYSQNDFRNTVRHIIFSLYNQILKNQEPVVIKSAISVMVKIYKLYHFLGIDLLFEVASVKGLPDFVQETAISGLKQIFEFQLKSLGKKHSNFAVQTDESNPFRALVDALYSKDKNIRKTAQKVFELLISNSNLREEYYKFQSLKAKELVDKMEVYRSEKLRLTYTSTKKYVPPPFESWFEVDVFLEIHKKGYIVLPQYAVDFSKGDINFDFVIMSENKKTHLALECDGNCHIYRKQKDRRRDERVKSKGWLLWRITHSKKEAHILKSVPFYSHYPNWHGRIVNKKVLQILWKKLDELDIKPVLKPSSKFPLAG